MAGLLGGGGNNNNGGGGGLLGGLLNTVDDTTKGLPIVGSITSPLLKTVGGVTDGLPIVCIPLAVMPEIDWHVSFHSLAPVVLEDNSNKFNNRNKRHNGRLQIRPIAVR